MSTETDIRYLLDRIEIQDVIARYGLGQDLHQPHDPDLNVLEHWSHVFAPGAVLDYTDALGGGPMTMEQMAKWMRGKDLAGGGMTEWFRVWQHLEGHATVTIDGDTATSITPHLHTHETKDGNGNVLAAGLWYDQWERRPEGWRITGAAAEGPLQPCRATRPVQPLPSAVVGSGSDITCPAPDQSTRSEPQPIRTWATGHTYSWPGSTPRS
ncbi:nuclear transport factor 2 family protein [Streptomyces sp. R08]|uniref:Nuclear transport factor 2 family protein n=1 Tax=Streptomyces sp. R08 TaxID=3238624 RepID=A0AB39MQZ2_9ACTN